MDKRFNLKSEDVFNKQFNIDFKGYTAEEVDMFLDLVIEDYQNYEKMVSELGSTLQRYEATIEALQQKLNSIDKAEPTTTAYSNVDILKRLSRLEAEVFKK